MGYNPSRHGSSGAARGGAATAGLLLVAEADGRCCGGGACSGDISRRAVESGVTDRWRFEADDFRPEEPAAPVAEGESVGDGFALTRTSGDMMASSLSLSVCVDSIASSLHNAMPSLWLLTTDGAVVLVTEGLVRDNDPDVVLLGSVAVVAVAALLASEDGSAKWSGRMGSLWFFSRHSTK